MYDPLDATMKLVQAAQAGEDGALNSLFERYYPRVRKVLRLRMGDKLRRRVESSDLLQETFADAVRSFDRFEMRSEASLINWLARLAERRLLHAVDRLGAVKRDLDREVPLAAGTDDSGGERDPGSDSVIPLSEAIRSEESATVEACLQRLPERYREIIILRNYVGLAFAEIAEETGRPSDGAARMLHAKAMIELARGVKDELGQSGG